jgi:hypothetical protein
LLECAEDHWWSPAAVARKHTDVVEVYPPRTGFNACTVATVSTVR